MIEAICKILGIARRTYFHWQKSDDKAYGIKLFNKYFTQEELEEFIETGKISKQDRLNELLEIEKKYNQILQIVESKTQLE